jgi:hypothetical protein
MTARCPLCKADVALVTRELLLDPGHPFKVLSRHTREESSWTVEDGKLVKETRQVRCPGSLEEVGAVVRGDERERPQVRVRRPVRRQRVGGRR